MRPGKVLALQKNVKTGRFLHPPLEGSRRARGADRRQRLGTDEKESRCCSGDIEASFRGVSNGSAQSAARWTRTRNLCAYYIEIPRCAISHLRSGPSDHPGMTSFLPLLLLADFFHRRDQARAVVGDEFRKFRRIEVGHRTARGLEGFCHLRTFDG